MDETDQERRQPVPLTLLGGFLGAGKTTVLNRIVRANHGVRLGVLVNDFGEIDIDAELIAKVDGETITLINGCICCTIRDDMLLSLFRLLHRPDAPEQVLIEASGVSDPAAVVAGFEQARMFDIVRIESVVSIADAELLAEIEWRERPLALHQLVVADLVVLNKVDLVDKPTEEDLIARIRESIPRARVLSAVHGEVPVDLLLGVGRFDPERLIETEVRDVHVHRAGAGQAHADAYDTWAFKTTRPLDLDRLRPALEQLPPAIYRAKGIVDLAQVPDRRMVVQIVGRRVELDYGPAWNDDPRESKFVAIGHAGELEPETLEASLRACEADRPVAGAKPNILSWLRRALRR